MKLSWLLSLLFALAASVQCVSARAGEAPAGSLAPASASAVLPSTLIELDGTSSVSPDGGELSYEWKQLSGPKIELSNPLSAKPYFRTSQPGIYEFELVVEANGLKSEPHLVRLEIERENLPPVAKLLPEFWGQVGKAMEIDGGASVDPEGSPLTYRWRALSPGLVLPDASLDKPVLILDPAADGVFEVELVVSDGEKVSAPAVARLTVKPRPKPPIAKVEVKTLKAGVPAAPDIVAMAPPASVAPPPPDIAPSITVPRAAPVASASAAPLRPPPDALSPATPPPAASAAGQIVAPPPALTTSQPAAPASVAPVSAPAAPVPAARPRVPASAPIQRRLPPPVARIDGPVVAKAGDTVTLDARASSGASGNRLEYLWSQKSGAFVNGFELVFDGAAERFNAPRPGDYEFELVVVDAGVESAPVVHALRVVEEEDPPVAVVVAPTRAMPGALVKMDATQSYDMAGSPLVYRWRQTGGPAVKNYVIDENLGDAAPAFHPPTAGVYSFELIVSNGRMTSRPIEIDIEVGDARVPPGMSISGPEAAHAGANLAWDIAVSGADPRAFVFEWRQSEGPANAVLQSQGTRSLIMAPIPGRYVFSVTMRDRAGKVLSTASRALEVFKNGTGSGAGAPVVQPPSPVQTASADTGARRVVPEISPLPNAPAVPPPTRFPRPAPSRSAAHILRK